MQNLIYPIDNITRIEYHGQPVLTTTQLAEALSNPDNGQFVTVESLGVNYRNHRDRFIEGKHFFKVEGAELDILRQKNFLLQISLKARVVYLWTKRGVARHCKSVGTDVAWDVFERLEDTYFNVEKILKDVPLKSISEYKIAIALTRFAAHADDPYMKKRLVAEAANRLLGEKVFPVPDFSPCVQLTLFKEG